MTKYSKIRLLVPLVILFTFIVVGSTKVYKALAIHDTVHIISASFGIICSLSGIILIVYLYLKNNKEAKLNLA